VSARRVDRHRPPDDRDHRAASHGITIVTSTFRRNAPDATSPSIKSLNYLNNILARIEANDRGADEALMLDGQGYVSEATVDNFFIVTDHALLTPPTATNLKGVTRETLLGVAVALGIKARRSRSRCSTSGRRRKRSSAAPRRKSSRSCRSTIASSAAAGSAA
jgi:branched-subunit amino acid aminotransferase/4-amino-4-deoxychorismate lyase